MYYYCNGDFSFKEVTEEDKVPEDEKMDTSKWESLHSYIELVVL